MDWQAIATVVAAIIGFAGLLYVHSRRGPDSDKHSAHGVHTAKNSEPTKVATKQFSLGHYEEDFLRLRKENGVRRLRTIEDSKEISNLPMGVYGFTTPLNFNPPTFLHRSRGGTYQVEVHKSLSGKIYLLGFVSYSVQNKMND